MKNVVLRTLSVVAVMALPVLASAQSADGVWRTELTEDGHLEIEISRCKSALCGRIIGAWDARGNTGPYEHMNKLMIWDMTADDVAGSWSGGIIWDPRSGRSFKSRMTLDQGRLKVAGCVLGFCLSQTWTRVR